MHARFYAGSKPLVLSFAFLFGLLLSVATLAAPEAVGTLAESRGKVEINGAAVTPGAELRLGMRVATGSSSQAVLKFADGQTVFAPHVLLDGHVQFVAANADKLEEYEKIKPE